MYLAHSVGCNFTFVAPFWQSYPFIKHTLLALPTSRVILQIMDVCVLDTSLQTCCRVPKLVNCTCTMRPTCLATGYVFLEYFGSTNEVTLTKIASCSCT